MLKKTLNLRIEKKNSCDNFKTSKVVSFCDNRSKFIHQVIQQSGKSQGKFEIINRKRIFSNDEVSKTKLKAQEKYSKKLPNLYIQHTLAHKKLTIQQQSKPIISKNQREQLKDISFSNKSKEQQKSQIYNLKMKMFICSRKQQEKNEIIKSRKISTLSIMHNKGKLKNQGTKRINSINNKREKDKQKDKESQEMKFQPIVQKKEKKKQQYLEELLKRQKCINSYLMSMITLKYYQQKIKQKLPYYDFWKNIKPRQIWYFGHFICQILRRQNLYYTIKFFMLVNNKYYICLHLDISWNLERCVKEVTQFINQLINQQQPCISHIYCGKVNLLKLQYCNYSLEKEQIKIGIPLKQNKKFDTALFIPSLFSDKQNNIKKTKYITNRKNKIVKQGTQVYAVFFLERFQAQNKWYNLLYNIIIFSKFADQRNLISKLKPNSLAFFKTIINKTSKKSIKITLKCKKQFAIYGVEVIQIQNISYLVLRIHRILSLQQNINIVLLLSNCLTKQQKNSYIKLIIQRNYKNILDLKNLLLKFSQPSRSWNQLILNKSLLRVSSHSYIIKASNKIYYKIKYHLFSQQNCIIWIYQSSKNIYFSVASWQDFFIKTFHDFSQLYRTRKKKIINMKTENNGHLDRQKEGEYKNESKDKLIEKYFGQIIKSNLKIVEKDSGPEFSFKENSLQMHKTQYQWIERSDNKFIKFCFVMDSHQIFTINIKQDYIVSKVYRLQLCGCKSQNYDAYKERLRKQKQNCKRFLVSNKVLYSYAKHNDRLNISICGLPLIKLKHPAQYLCDFQGQSSQKLQQVVYHNRRMIRRSLMVVDQHIAHKIKLFTKK